MTTLNAKLAEAAIHADTAREQYVDAVHHVTAWLRVHHARTGDLTIPDLDAVGHSARLLLEAVEEYRLELAVRDALADVAGEGP